MKPWELMIIVSIVIPILKRIATLFETKAAATPDKADDIRAGIFRAAITLLEDTTTLVYEDTTTLK